MFILWESSLGPQESTGPLCCGLGFIWELSCMGERTRASGGCSNCLEAIYLIVEQTRSHQLRNNFVPGFYQHTPQRTMYIHYYLCTIHRLYISQKYCTYRHIVYMQYKYHLHLCFCPPLWKCTVWKSAYTFYSLTLSIFSSRNFSQCMGIHSSTTQCGRDRVCFKLFWLLNFSTIRRLVFFWFEFVFLLRHSDCVARLAWNLQLTAEVS